MQTLQLAYMRETSVAEGAFYSSLLGTLELSWDSCLFEHAGFCRASEEKAPGFAAPPIDGLISFTLAEGVTVSDALAYLTGATPACMALSDIIDWLKSSISAFNTYHYDVSEGEANIAVYSLMNKKEGMSLEEFQSYHHSAHAPKFLAAAKQSGKVLEYSVSHHVPGMPSAQGLLASDALVSILFEDRKALFAFFMSDAYRKEITKDEKAFIAPAGRLNFLCGPAFHAY